MHRPPLTAKLDDLGRMVRSDFEVNDPPTAQQAVRDVRAELESAEPNRKTIRDRLAALASASQSSQTIVTAVDALAKAFQGWTG